MIEQDGCIVANYLRCASDERHVTVLHHMNKKGKSTQKGNFTLVFLPKCDNAITHIQS